MADCRFRSLVCGKKKRSTAQVVTTQPFSHNVTYIVCIVYICTYEESPHFVHVATCVSVVGCRDVTPLPSLLSREVDAPTGVGRTGGGRKSTQEFASSPLPPAARCFCCLLLASILLQQYREKGRVQLFFFFFFHPFPSSISHTFQSNFSSTATATAAVCYCYCCLCYYHII